MSRKPIVVGNWKMNTTRAEAVALANGVAEGTKATTSVEVGVAPPFVYIPAVSMALCDASSNVLVGAQNAWHEDKGAFTGEVSISQLKDVGTQLVILGHSERRHVINEPDEVIQAKTEKSLASGLLTILCIGETLEQREAGETDRINKAQLRSALTDLTLSDPAKLVIAYEPVWAIGTGKTATPHDAQAAHAAIRTVLADLFDQGTADAVRIQYGGSMKPENAAELLAQPDIDGGLIGGASLKPDAFLAIVNAAAS